MFSFSINKPLPDFGLYGVHKRFQLVVLDTLSTCHNHCIFCPYHDDPLKKHGVMSLTDLEHALQSIPSFNGEVALNLGGEAFGLADLPERCALIKKYWPDCFISLLTTFNKDKGKSYLARLFSSGLDALSISCYGHTASDYKMLHGTDLFASLCNNINNLKEATDTAQHRIRVEIFYQDSSRRLGITDGQKKEEAFLDFLKNSGIQRVLRKSLTSVQGRVPWPSHWEGRVPYPCSVVWGHRANSLIVRWNLDIVPCCFFCGGEIVLGNLRDTSVSEIFNSPAYRNFYAKHWARDIKDLPVCNSCDVTSHSPSPGELTRLAAFEGQRLAGQDVYFWGCGESYREYKIYFARVKAKAILLDSEGTQPNAIDGIPVLHPDDALLHGEKLPLIIFAHPVHNGRIIGTIEQKYPDYAREDIILCPACSHQPGKPVCITELV